MNSFKVLSGAFDGPPSWDTFPDILCKNDMVVIASVAVQMGWNTRLASLLEALRIMWGCDDVMP